MAHVVSWSTELKDGDFPVCYVSLPAFSWMNTDEICWKLMKQWIQGSSKGFVQSQNEELINTGCLNLLFQQGIHEHKRSEHQCCQHVNMFFTGPKAEVSRCLNRKSFFRPSQLLIPTNRGGGIFSFLPISQHKDVWDSETKTIQQRSDFVDFAWDSLFNDLRSCDVFSFRFHSP